MKKSSIAISDSHLSKRASQFGKFTCTKFPLMFRILVATTLTFGCHILPVAAQVYNVASDFSLVGNPNGAWSYGTTGTTTNGALSLFTNSSSSFGGNSNIHAWTGTETAFGFNYPFVGRNTAATGQDGGGGFVPLLPGQLYMAPSPTGAYSVVRFTTPVDGLYQLDAIFQGRDVRGTTTDVHILLNGTSIFNGILSGFGDPSNQSYFGLQTLLAGDRLDFAVGYGPNQTFFQDSTALAASVSAVPEPSSFAIFGLIGVGFIGIRRK